MGLHGGRIEAKVRPVLGRRGFTSNVGFLARLRICGFGQKRVFAAGRSPPNQLRRTQRCRTLKRRPSCVAELKLTVVHSKGLSDRLARLALSSRGQEKVRLSHWCLSKFAARVAENSVTDKLRGTPIGA